MNPVTIDHLVSNAAQIFINAGYTERSVGEKVWVWKAILKMHKENDLDHYDQRTADLFIEDASAKYEAEEIGRIRYLHLVKSAQYLLSLHETGTIDNLGKRNIPTGLTAAFEETVTKLLSYSEWGEKTKRNLRQSALPYLKWLQSYGHDSFTRVTKDDIRAYLIDCSSRMTVNSIDTVRRNLKKFHFFLFDTGITQDSFDEVFSFNTPPAHRILKPVQHTEIKAILDVIDRSTGKGKRDYAIFMLAVVLGLRAVDITELRFDEVDWINGEIRIVQSKTEKTLALPLTKDVGTALQDYILNGRPKSDEPYIFLTMKSPFTKMGSSNPNQLFQEYKKKAGVQGGTFHGLRRSLGTNMVIEGVPVTTVAQVLGHSSIEPTKQYISLDCRHLKPVALGLNGLPQYGGARP